MTVRIRMSTDDHNTSTALGMTMSDIEEVLRDAAHANAERTVLKLKRHDGEPMFVHLDHIVAIWRER